MGTGRPLVLRSVFYNLPCSAEYASASLAGSASFVLRYRSHHWHCLSDTSPGRNAPGSRERASSPGGIDQAAPWRALWRVFSLFCTSLFSSIKWVHKGTMATGRTKAHHPHEVQSPRPGTQQTLYKCKLVHTQHHTVLMPEVSWKLGPDPPALQRR